jgi:HK97 family phage portal protein
MNWLQRLSNWRAERKATQLTYDQIAALLDGGAGGRMVAGLRVTDKTALQVSTVLACVKVLADGCATPDLHVMREVRTPDGKLRGERATNIPEYRLLARRPNEFQTSLEWRRQMTAHAALTGTGLSVKATGSNGRVRELLPVQPSNWDVRRVSRYEVRYRVWDEFGLIGEFTPQQVFVVQGLQWDWLRAMDAVRLVQQAVGLAMATEQSQAAFYANGIKTSGAYAVEGTLVGDQYERLQEHIAKNHIGVEKHGLPMILDRSAKWISSTMSNVDAQLDQTRARQVEEICRGYGVFPLMIGHSDKTSTFASSEAFFAAHLKHTLTPWHKAWTQRADETLLDGNGPLYCMFDTRYLQAGSMKDRAVWARAMREMGIYTGNELRAEEGLDPLPGLDEPLTPLNMQSGGGGAADPGAGDPNT